MRPLARLTPAAATRVAVDVREGAELLHERVGNARLLAQLALGRLLECLARVHKAARERPVALIGLVAPPHEEHVHGTVSEGEHGHVCRDARMLDNGHL